MFHWLATEINLSLPEPMGVWQTIINQFGAWGLMAIFFAVVFKASERAQQQQRTDYLAAQKEQREDHLKSLESVVGMVNTNTAAVLQLAKDTAEHIARAEGHWLREEAELNKAKRPA